MPDCQYMRGHSDDHALLSYNTYRRFAFREYLIGKLTRTFKRSQFYDLIDNAFLYPQKVNFFSMIHLQLSISRVCQPIHESFGGTESMILLLGAKNDFG